MLASPKLDKHRNSVSRSRERLVATGRGGAGNIKTSSSGGRNSEENYSPTRGLELSVDGDTTKPLGRGGVGNILTQSRARDASRFTEGHPHAEAIVAGALARTVAYERSIIAETSTVASGVRSSGRGGAGNISNSRPRPRGPSLKMFKRTRTDKSRRRDKTTTPSADTAAAPAPQEQGGKHAKNTGMGARAKRIPAIILLRRRRVPTPSDAPLSPSSGNAPTPPPSLKVHTAAATSSSVHPNRHVSVIDIRKRASSLSYARLSTITLPPSPIIDSPSRDDDSFILPPDSPMSDTSSQLSDSSSRTAGSSTPPSSFMCGPGSLRSLSPSLPPQLPPPQGQAPIFHFPDVPTYLPLPQIKIAGAHALGTRSAPSLPTLQEDHEYGVSESFANLRL